MFSYSHGNRDSQTPIKHPISSRLSWLRAQYGCSNSIAHQSWLQDIWKNHISSKEIDKIRLHSPPALSFGVSHEFSTYSVLLKFRKSLFSCIHEETWSIQYQYGLAFSSMAVLAAKNSTESSSAYKQIQEGISFMYYLKSRGPKGDPWGKPEIIFRGVERTLLTATRWDRPCK